MFPEDEQADAAVQRAARAVLARLARELESEGEGLARRTYLPVDPDEATHEAERVLRFQVAQFALTFPRMSIGTCAIDGTPLRYVGREEGLFVCCTAPVQHCWQLG